MADGLFLHSLYHLRMNNLNLIVVGRRDPSLVLLLLGMYQSNEEVVVRTMKQIRTLKGTDIIVFITITTSETTTGAWASYGISFTSFQAKDRECYD